MMAISGWQGSFPWLLAHDMRLGWRGATAIFGPTSRRTIWGMLIAGTLVMHVLAWPVVLWLSPLLHGADAGLAPLTIIVSCTFSWLLAQSLFSASRTLFARGDLDLLLGSPLPPSRVLAAKASSIAAGSFGSIALLTLPVANVGALVDDIAWLGAYPALVAMTLIATAMGLSITIALFGVLGPVRARLWTQMTGAAIAGSFVLGAQVTAMLPASMRASLAERLEVPIGATSASPTSFLRLPIDTLRGDIGSAALLMGIAILAFAAATMLLGKRLANASIAAAGAAAGDEHGGGALDKVRFRAGLTTNLQYKEWRLLARDPGMFAQLALQIIYTVPVAVVLLRNEALPPIFALAPTIVVIAAQVAASLSWITVSGEDAPELIATAPVARGAVDRAKLASVALPVLTILSLPLAALAFVSWQTAVVTAVVAAAASTSTALLNFWHPMPGNRRGMLRRHSQSKLVALLEHGLALLWAVAIVLVLMGSVLVVVPLILVVALLVRVRRNAMARH